MKQIIGHYILFRVHKFDLPGGILLPETMYRKTLRLGKFAIGEVLKVGSKVELIKQGSYFVFNEYSVTGADDPTGLVEGQEYSIKDSEIRCLFSSKPNSVFRDNKNRINVCLTKN